MLVMVRDKRTEKAILGRLFLGCVFICYTLENAAKAIPAGLYNVENSKSPKFKRELPLLYNKDVPAKRGVRIHVGNTYKESSACVLVGMGRKGDKLVESAQAETMVTMLCRNVRQLAIVDLQNRTTCRRASSTGIFYATTAPAISEGSPQPTPARQG